MNVKQREFIIERIQKKTKEKIAELESKRLEYPSASNYFFKAALNGQLQLQPQEVTLAAIKAKAMNAKEGHNWLSEDRMGVDKETTVRIPLKDLFIYPKDYEDERARVKEHNESLNKQIAALKLQLESIEVRVHLASDKTLQAIINEVDDMGMLSLIDTKLKLPQ